MVISESVLSDSNGLRRDFRVAPVPQYCKPVGKGDCFLPSRFSSSFKQSEGLAPLSRWTRRFARPFQPTSFGRGLRNRQIRRSVIPPRLMMAHEPRVGPDRSAPTAGK
jgi:hypothetical protein